MCTKGVTAEFRVASHEKQEVIASGCCCKSGLIRSISPSAASTLSFVPLRPERREGETSNSSYDIIRSRVFQVEPDSVC